MDAHSPENSLSSIAAGIPASSRIPTIEHSERFADFDGLALVQRCQIPAEHFGPDLHNASFVPVDWLPVPVLFVETVTVSYRQIEPSFDFT